MFFFACSLGSTWLNTDVLADVYKVLIDHLWDRIFIEKMMNYPEVYIDNEWPRAMYPDSRVQIFNLKPYKC